MSEQRIKAWPGEPPGLWPAPEPAVKDERRTDDERVEVIHQGVRIDHAVSRRVGAALSAFVDRPWEEHQRWRGLLLVGPARSGRSWLVSRWLPKDERAYSQAVVKTSLPADPTHDRILHAILAATSTYGVPDYKGHELRTRASRALKDVRAIVIDDCDQLTALSKPRLWRALAWIKGIGERERVAVVLVVNPAILQAVSEHPDWEPRFEALHLPRLRVDPDYLALLTEWENVLPLQGVSRLADREMALHLYSLCDGSIGRLGRVLREASLAAIDNGRERISLGLLDQLGFTPPPSFREFLF